MRLVKTGLNTIVCVLKEYDISLFGIRLSDVLNNTDEEAQQIMNEMMNVIIRILLEHSYKEGMIDGLPMTADVLMREDAIEIHIKIPIIPVELFDFQDGYDEEIELAEYMNEPNENINNEDEQYPEGVFDEVQDAENVETNTETSEKDNTDIEEKTANVESETIKYMFQFKKLEEAITYAKTCEKIKTKPVTSLYKYDENYWMICEFEQDTKVDMKQYFYIISEWDAVPNRNVIRIAHIKEHGKVLIAEKALETLSEL